MQILIPAKSTSRRIPRKNMAMLGRQPLLGWAIDKARGWFPEAAVHVATDDAETIRFAKESGCEIFLDPRPAEEQQDATVLFGEFCARLSARPAVLMQCTSPFTFRSEICGALRDPRPALWSGWAGVLHDVEHGHALSQELPATAVWSGNFLIVKGPGFPSEAEWLSPETLFPVSWISTFQVDEPADLDLARKLAEIVDHSFLSRH